MYSPILSILEKSDSSWQSFGFLCLLLSIKKSKPHPKTNHLESYKIVTLPTKLLHKQSIINEEKFWEFYKIFFCFTEEN